MTQEFNFYNLFFLNKTKIRRKKNRMNIIVPISKRVKYFLIYFKYEGLGFKLNKERKKHVAYFVLKI